MKPTQRMYIALGVSVPVAILLIWWVYHKKQKNDAVGTAAQRKLAQNKPTPSESEKEDFIDLRVATELVTDEPGHNNDPCTGESEEVNGSKLDSSDKSVVVLQEPQASPRNNNKIESSDVTDVTSVIVSEDSFVNSQPVTLHCMDEESTPDDPGSDATSEPTPSCEVVEDADAESTQTHSSDSCEQLGDPTISENATTTNQTSQEDSSFQSVYPEDNESVELLNKAVLTSIRVNMSIADMESSQSETVPTDVEVENSTQMDDCKEQGSEDEDDPVALHPDNVSFDDTSVAECLVQNEDEEERVEVEVEAQNKDSDLDGYKKEDAEAAIAPEITAENTNSDEEVGKNSYTPSSLSSLESETQNGDETHAESAAFEKESDGIEDSTLESQSFQPNDSELSQGQEGDSMTNANNNNNLDDVNSKPLSDKSLKQCNGHANGMGDGDSKGVLNGHTEDVAKKENEFSHATSTVGSHTSSFLNGTLLENPIEETQMYLEFPSDKVGLLIGKAGRNIKLLKQESGAEIMVHTVPFRDDIQVLQIVGTSSSVDSAISKIQGRFREVSLNEFDASHILESSNSFQSPLDSPATPPTFAYPIPEMSQLQLPEGIPVEVVVSAISDCDSVFLQQYTHPTFHALASLEQAMSVCYSSGSTPALLSPVQVGLVCVAQHQDVWYRAQVIHASEDSNEVTIKYVDYGGYSTVPTSTVKQIRADFITLPFQASECYLDNIAPLEGEEAYGLDSTKILQDLLMEGEFHAQISRYRDDGHPLIQLFKRHNNETQLVNRLLVERGVARWVNGSLHRSAPLDT